MKLIEFISLILFIGICGCYESGSNNFDADNDINDAENNDIELSNGDIDEECDRGKIKKDVDCEKYLGIRFCLPFKNRPLQKIKDILGEESSWFSCCASGSAHPANECEQLQCIIYQAIELNEDWWSALCEISMIEEVEEIVIDRCYE